MTEGHTERLEAALASRYRIERKLGEGGMASVYLAEDRKHKRNVALKILRPELAAVLGADRFLAEIQTTAQLQHPHILPLFDSGSADGYLYYVMPYIDGETLREKLDREKQLGVEESVRIARDVADALDYAHRHGVIHRDIKPANILLHDGRPVVSDFGIALAVTAAGGGRMTETGLSLGTPHYMSPEQASADRDLSARSDVYSLGCVLYEMLAGQPPHTGPSAQSILVHILTEEPKPLTELRHTVPPNVAAAIAKSIEKLPADRFETAKEFRDALEDTSFAYQASTTPPRGVPAARVVAGAPSAGRWRTPLVGAAGLLGGLLLAWSWSALRPEPPRPVTRVSVRLPEGQGFNATRGDFDLSPDGSLFVYRSVGEDGQGILRARRWSELEASVIRGTETATRPRISPDGREVVFSTSGGIRVAPVEGGVSRTLATEGTDTPGWSADGAWVYFKNDVGGLSRVPSSGGEAEVLTYVDSAGGDVQHVFPLGLPDDKVLFTVMTRDGDDRIQALDVSSGRIEDVTSGRYPLYSPTGHLLFQDAVDPTLLAAPFDPDGLELTGPAVPIADGLLRVGQGSAANVAISRTGRLVYRVGSATGLLYAPSWVDRDGTSRDIEAGWTVRGTAIGYGLALSPSGDRLAISILGTPSTDIWIKDLGTGTLSRLTFGGTVNVRPAWSPDGRSVLFGSDRLAGGADLWSQRADGGGSAEPVLDAPGLVVEGTYSPDGNWLVYREGTGGSDQGDIWGIRLGQENEPVPLMVDPSFAERSPAVSPDSRWIAYQSNESGRDEVYVRPFPRTNERRWLVSTGGGTEPVWSHSGRELFYRNGDSELVSVRVRTQPGDDASFAWDGQDVLFSVADYLAGNGHARYDVSPDDQRFVMLRSAGAAGAEAQLILVDNFFEGLRQRASN